MLQKKHIGKAEAFVFSLQNRTGDGGGVGGRIGAGGHEAGGDGEASARKRTGGGVASQAA
jgi:hypothetical protein